MEIRILLVYSPFLLLNHDNYWRLRAATVKVTMTVNRAEDSPRIPPPDPFGSRPAIIMFSPGLSGLKALSLPIPSPELHKSVEQER